MVIAVRDTREILKSLAPIERFREVKSTSKNDFGVRRINANLAVIHRAIVLVANEAPRFPFVVRAPDARLFRIGGLIGLLPKSTTATSAATTLPGLAGLSGLTALATR